MQCTDCALEGVEVLMPEGDTHHAKVACPACGRHLAWLPKPMDFDRASAYGLPFGQFKGLTVREVANTPRGREYLRWLLDQPSFKGPVRRAIEVYRAGVRERSNTGRSNA